MRATRGKLVQGLAGGIVLALLLAVSPIGIRLEHLLLDLHTGYLPLHNATGEVVLVTLDDTSFDVMAESMDGLRWPYPRAVHAQVIRALIDAGAKAVAVDIIFDLPSGFGAEDDTQLAAAVGSGKVFLAGEDSATATTPVLPLLAAAGATAANAAITVDEDASVRWSADAERLPETSLEICRYFFGFHNAGTVARKLHSFAEVVLQQIYPGISVKRGLISYPARNGRVPRIPYFQVYNPQLFAEVREQVRNKIVFLGRTPSASITPQNQSDVFFTPTGFMPGVEIHAYHFLSLLSGQIRKPIPSSLIPYMLLIWTAVLSTGFFYFKRFSAIACFALCTAIFWEGLVVILFSMGWIIPALLPASLSVAMTIGSLAVRYVEERDARLITRAQLLHYLPPRVAEFVLRNPSKLAMAGDRKEITLLFADVAGFTTLSEIESPERILSLLQTHLKDMAEAIFSHDGTLDKYLGDGIMAFWGAPEAQAEQADLALAAALEMLRRVDSQNEVRRAQGIPCLNLRIGLHTGDAIVGNIGSELFFDYTAIGNTVNTAARLEGANKAFATRVLISDAVKARLSGSLLASVRAVGRIAVQGRQEPIAVYTVPEPAETLAFDDLSPVLQYFETGQMQLAKEALSEVYAKHSSFKPARFYLEQIAKSEVSKFDVQGRAYWPLDSK